MLAISPGGVYEAQFGDSYYQLMWKKRVGFAKVALDAKVVLYYYVIILYFPFIFVQVLNINIFVTVHSTFIYEEY